jgi:prepilin-type N-terminal cleavage/methylation domain-containing protein
MKRLFNKSGMTLVEVLIAVALLALITAGALGIVQTGVFVSAQSTRAMIADVTAQQLVEELVGRNQAEITNHLQRIVAGTVETLVTSTDTSRNATTSDGVRYELTVVFGYIVNGVVYDDLAAVTVNIMDGTNTIHSLEMVLNIGE